MVNLPNAKPRSTPWPLPVNSSDTVPFVITCAAESHLEAFGSVANVAREKGDILTFQSGRDTAVINADDSHASSWKQRARGNAITFGVKNAAENRCSAIPGAADVSARQLQLNAQGRAEFLVRFRDQIDGTVCDATLNIISDRNAVQQ